MKITWETKITQKEGKEIKQKWATKKEGIRKRKYAGQKILWHARTFVDNKLYWMKTIDPKWTIQIFVVKEEQKWKVSIDYCREFVFITSFHDSLKEALKKCQKHYQEKQEYKTKISVKEYLEFVVK